MNKKNSIFFATVISSISATSLSADLSSIQSRELTVFAGKAMGLALTLEDVEDVLPSDELNKLIATGINLNGFLCASIQAIQPLKIESTYEVSCVAYRDGTAQKSYIIDALKGVAFEP